MPMPRVDQRASDAVRVDPIRSESKGSHHHFDHCGEQKKVVVLMSSKLSVGCTTGVGDAGISGTTDPGQGRC